MPFIDLSTFTADSTGFRADLSWHIGRARTFVVPTAGLPYRSPDPFPGFSCTAAVTAPPRVPFDRLTAPTGDTLLPQVLLNAPRGRAWQSDETQAPLGSTYQHRVWAVIADAFAGVYGMLTRATLSAFPTVTDEAGLSAWEADYGLPDPCLGDNPSLDRRRKQVRAVLALPDTASRQDLVCLCALAGFDVEVLEQEGFELGWSGFAEEGFGHPDLPHSVFVDAPRLSLSWLTLGETGFGEDGFGTYPADGLICLIERARQAHIRVYYLIQGAVL